MTDLDKLDALAEAATPDTAILDWLDKAFDEPVISPTTYRLLVRPAVEAKLRDLVAAARERDELREALKFIDDNWYDDDSAALDRLRAALHSKDGAS